MEDDDVCASNISGNDRDTSDEEEIASLPDEEAAKAEQSSAKGNSDDEDSEEESIKIAHCKLTRISLRGYTDVTDASLKYLTDHDLELLDVSYTNVSAKGVKDFMLAHPKCRVLHESACTCRPRMHF